MKVREHADEGSESWEVEADFPITCRICGDVIGYRTGPISYSFCISCHDDREDQVVGEEALL